MATISMIDALAPLWVSPLTRRLVTFDFSLSNGPPAQIETAEPTSGADALQFAEAAEVLAWLNASRWLSRLERDLQCVANDRDGRPILTTWLDFEQFAQLVSDAQDSALAARFQQVHDAWLAAGADLVHFDFYALEETSTALIH